MALRRPVVVDGEWKYGVASYGPHRDGYWTMAYELARKAIAERGKQCVACGGWLWSRVDTGRLYCDDTCRRRHMRRRDRYKETLRRQDEPCQFCGSHV